MNAETSGMAQAPVLPPRNSPEHIEWRDGPNAGGAVYVTKDSGKRAEYTTGMVRDTQEGKARFALLWPRGVPYEAQFLTRVAELMTRGIEKYGDRNWEKACTQEEMDRFHESAHRHLAQWEAGDTEEDHAVAVVFNLLAAETVSWKMEHPLEGVQQ